MFSAIHTQKSKSRLRKGQDRSCSAEVNEAERGTPSGDHGRLTSFGQTPQTDLRITLVLVKTCATLQCDMGDIIELAKDVV